MGACLKKQAKAQQVGTTTSGDQSSQCSEVVQVKEEPVKAEAAKPETQEVNLTPKPKRIGWSVGEDGKLCHYVMIDKIHGEKVLQLFEKYPKTKLVRFGCTLDTSHTAYKGSEKVLLTFKHPENDFLSIDRSVRDFYLNKVLPNPHTRHFYTLGMDFCNPLMDDDVYIKRAKMFTNNELLDIYHDYPEEVPPFPETQDYQRGILIPPSFPTYEQLPVAPCRSPGWHWIDDGPAYVMLINRSDYLLNRLYHQKARMRLMHNCEGSLFRSTYNGEHVIVLKITHSEGSFRNIDGAVRTAQLSRFADLPYYYIYTHRNLRASGFDQKYCEKVLGLNQEEEEEEEEEGEEEEEEEKSASKSDETSKSKETSASKETSKSKETS